MGLDSVSKLQLELIDIRALSSVNSQIRLVGNVGWSSMKIVNSCGEQWPRETPGLIGFGEAIDGPYRRSLSRGLSIM